MSDEFSLAPVLPQLERIFVAGGMTRQAAKLAAFRAGYETQQERLARMSDKPWTSETVLELAAVYQLWPFARRYPVAPNDGRCPDCRVDLAGRNAAPVAKMYADRSVHSCRACSGRFVRIMKVGA